MSAIYKEGSYYGAGGESQSVVANPEGTATETLAKLGVDDTIYSIPSGGDAGDVAKDWFIRNGMKNQVKLTEASATSQTVTYTIDKDAGTVTVDGTNSSGSSTSYTFAMIVPQGYFQPGQYKFNGHPGGNASVGMRIRYNTGSSNVNLAIVSDSGDVAFEITDAIAAAATGGYNIMIAVAAGATADNVVLKPQIRYASVTDDSIENYTPTNKELKDMLAPMPSADMSDVVTPLPSVPARYHRYSTTEQIVGEWIDGKPVYEKILHGAGPSTASQTTYPHNIADVEGIWVENSWWTWSTQNYFGTNGETAPLPVPGAANNINANCAVIKAIDKTNVTMWVNENRSNSSWTAIVRYTKTTD